MMMQKQVSRQENEMSQLRKSITDVSVIERQVLPLLSRMIDGLQEFVGLDVPFLLEERNARIGDLRKTLDRVDVTVAEKTRRVFEAFQIENEYGRTIESYRDKLLVGGKEFDVDYLRIGRVSLMYRKIGDQSVGRWDPVGGAWQSLESTKHIRYFNKALRVARQEIAPELITVPINFQGDR